MTKTLEFRNGEVVAVGNFLAGLKLKNKASRGRTKLIKLLDKKNKEFSEDRDEIRDPYFVKDESGKAVVKDNQYELKNKDKVGELNNKLNELAEEKAVIEFTEYNEKIKALYDALSNYTEDLSNSDAILYDLVMDQLENNFAKEGK
ncbi:DUF1617 family protein [Liquorilactobacillus satsumensis]|uniref:DUF1617 family protein n=1 Tax=Liquorilactobacillus satsumensis TaxID=259059 RepID=UPI0021C43D08|nr:DUF1617 family protein [Liquorilactobacillus satsumensis]MCP9358500.1 DUF1617 family protein [Liquorilactobacillus satsumensis]MCP9372454.1 DUF1617 family protein [Liquorilactobacillus satsumensis]